MTKNGPNMEYQCFSLKKISEKYLILYTCIYSGAVIVYTRDSKYPKMKGVENAAIVSTFDGFCNKHLLFMKLYKIADQLIYIRQFFRFIRLHHK